MAHVGQTVAVTKDPPGLMQRVNHWALRHPWRWATVSLVSGLLVVLGNPNSWVYGLLIAAVGYPVIGWSTAKGPARRFIVRRYGEPSA